MTVLAALRANGGVYMAADSAVQADGYRYEPTLKITRRALGGLDEEALIACSGDLRATAIIRHRLKLAAPGGDDALDRWAFDTASDLTKLLIKLKPPPTDDGQLDFEALLACRGRLWALSPHVAEPVDSYATCGTGGYHALGALSALDAAGLFATLSPEESLRVACNAAIRWDTRCVGPVHVESLPATPRT